MSLRPPKKTDKNKSWLRPRSGNSKKIRPEYHLIATNI